MMPSFADELVRALNRRLKVMHLDGTVLIRKAVGLDAHSLAPRLDPADVRELAASSGRESLPVLRESLALSDDMAWALDLGGDGSWEVHALFGVAGVQEAEGVGVPWMLGSSRLREQKRVLLALGRLTANLFSRRWGVLINQVHARNTRSVRWLRHIGFSLGDHPVPQGPHQEDFYPFIKEATCVNWPQQDSSCPLSAR